MKHALNLGKVEMEILRYIADHGPVTVRQVADHFARTRGHVRTTILNTMERLRAKRFLKRKRIDGLYQYATSRPRQALFGSLLRGFLDVASGRSHAPLVAYFVEHGNLTAEERRMLEGVAARMDKPR
jgi:predicted transcriptional regulator